MSIYPNGKPEGLRYKWDTAAIDVPVPDNLMSEADQQEWGSYLACLSPGQQLRKLGQALDQYHALLKATADPDALSDAEKITLYSKWQAVSWACGAVSKRFDYVAKEVYKDHDGVLFKSDIDISLYYLTSFLKEVHSTDLQPWEERRENQRSVDGRGLTDRIIKNAVSASRRADKPNGSPPAP